MPGLAAEEGFGAVAASVGQPDCPAGAALNVGYPVAEDFSPEELPAFPAEQVRVLFVLTAA
jgi:hypothetical protein